jgi:chaperonin GroES
VGFSATTASLADEEACAIAWKVSGVREQRAGVGRDILILEDTRMQLRPLHDRILVERIEIGEQKKGGIIIPDSAKEKPAEGKVIAVGPGKRLDDGTIIPPDVKPGDHILFGKYSGSEVNLDDTEYIIFREDEVLAVIEGAGKTEKAA